MAHNIIKYNNTLFIKSTKVKVFPCAYRGGRTVNISETTKKRIAFQPTSRAFTEENWTTSNHGDGVKDSYLVSTRSIDNGETEVRCVVGGYAFTLQLTEDDLVVLAGGASTTLKVDTQTSPRYLTISTLAQTMEDFTTTSTAEVSHKTTILASRTNSKIEVLDSPISGDAGIDTVDDDGTKFIFTGLSIENSKSASTGTSYLAVNKVENEELVWLNESYRLQNVLTTGTGANSVQTIDLDDTSTEIKESNVQKATGEQSIAFGYQSIASGEYSSTFGNNTTASGANSVAFGTETAASGENSVSIGSKTIAAGKNAISGGNASVANGENSVALGNNTSASTENQVVIGSFNTESDALFVIGNGTSQKNKKNVLTISEKGEMNLANGSANKLNIGGEGLGTGEVHVGDDNFNVDSTGTVDFRGNLKIGTKDDEEFVFDPTNKKLVLKSSLHQTGDLSIGASESSYKAKISANTGTLDLSDNTAELLMHAGATKNYFKVTTDTTNNTGKVLTDKEIIVDNDLTANNIIVDEDLMVTKNASIGGNEEITGYAKISGNFSTLGNAYFGKDNNLVRIQNSSETEDSSVQVNSDTTITGDVIIKSSNKNTVSIDAENFIVYPETTINNKLVTKDIVSSGNIELKTGKISTLGDITATNAAFTKTNTETLILGNEASPILEVAEDVEDIAGTLNYITSVKSRLNNVTIDDSSNVQSISSKNGNALGSSTKSYYLSTKSFNVIQNDDSQLKMTNEFLLKNPNITLNAINKINLQLNASDVCTIAPNTDKTTSEAYKITCSDTRLVIPYITATYSMKTDSLTANSSLETTNLKVKNADTNARLLTVNKDTGLMLETTTYMVDESGVTSAILDTTGNLSVNALTTKQIKATSIEAIDATVGGQKLLWHKYIPFTSAKGLNSENKSEISKYMLASLKLQNILNPAANACGYYIMQGNLTVQLYAKNSKNTWPMTVPATLQVRCKDGIIKDTFGYFTADVSSMCNQYAGLFENMNTLALVMSCNQPMTDGSVRIDPSNASNPCEGRLVLGAKWGSSVTYSGEQLKCSSDSFYPTQAYLFLTSVTFFTEDEIY